MILYDKLYGNIVIEPEIAAFFDFPEFYRLRFVAQGNNSFFSPTSVNPSRLEHSIGVYNLAKELAKKKEFEKDGLYLKVAAILHDIGHPPFGHASEPFLQEVFGLDHEQISLKIIEKKPIKKYIESLDLDVNRIVNLISGTEKPLGDLFNGSIDLDNIDNVIRWGTAVIGDTFNLYQPYKIINNLTLNSGKLVLKKEAIPEVDKWLKARQQLYSFIDNGLVKPADLMIRRAITFAYQNGDIGKEYFTMNDFEAMKLLLESNSKSKYLIEQLSKGRVYSNILTKDIEDDLAEKLRSWKTFDNIAFKIASLTNQDIEKVAVHISRYKGCRKIHLSILEKEEAVFENEVKSKWDIMIVSENMIELSGDQIEKLLKEEIKNYDEK